MKQNVTYKPLSNKEYKQVANNIKGLSWLILMTGARISEAHRIINEFNSSCKYIDIRTKKSGMNTNRIYLTDEAIKVLDEKFILKHKDKSVRTLQRYIEEESNKIGLIYTAHNLRATFATRLMQNGVDIISVQTLMNHSDVSVTAKYVQFNESKLRAGLNTLTRMETLEGKTNPELMEEIHRLRSQVLRLENDNE